MRGIAVRILSKRFSPLAMEAALGEFLAAQQQRLQLELTDAEVRERCASIVKSLQDPPTTPSEEASERWDAIVNGMPLDWAEQVIAQLQVLDREAVLDAANRWVFDTTTRASLSMMVFGPQHDAELQQLKTATMNDTNDKKDSGTSVAVDGNVKNESSAAPVLRSTLSSANQTSCIFSLEDLTCMRDAMAFYTSP